MNTNTYMILNGKDSREAGIYIVDPLPSVLSPAKILNVTKIPGRSQAVTVWDGSYEEIPKTPRLYFDGIDPQAACDFLNAAETVTFSNEPSKQYVCRNSGAISVDRLKKRKHLFDFPLLCCGEKRDANPQEITAVSGMTLFNPGNRKTRPTIEVTGTGTIVLDIAGQVVTLTEVAGTIIIDGELQECYTSLGVSANLQMTGDFPVLLPDTESIISWTGAATILIKPNWRWV